MLGHPTLHTRNHEVLDADIGKSAAGHDAVVAAARSVTIEVRRLDAVFDQIFPRRRSCFDRASRRNVVGRDGITENTERTRSSDVGDLPRVHGEVFEERRVLDVSALVVPRVELSGRARDLVPLRVLPGEIRVKLAEDFRLERGLHAGTHLVERGPKVAKINLLAVLVFAQRFLGEVDIDSSGQGEGHHERWGHEEVRFDVLMDARFEVAVARQNGRCHEIVSGDRLLHGLRERARVADARRAPVADDLESEFVEIGLEPCRGEIVLHHTRAGGQGSLHRGRDVQAALDRFLRQQARADHHARIARVRAAGDCRDDHTTVIERSGPVALAPGHIVRRGSILFHFR